MHKNHKPSYRTEALTHLDQAARALEKGHEQWREEMTLHVGSAITYALLAVSVSVYELRKDLAPLLGSTPTSDDTRDA